ncbi:MAG: hypothetical protein K5864_09700 [Bacteroidales bacterium]|nr:hypothetical protein [Bacteroidales bacterium]
MKKTILIVLACLPLLFTSCKEDAEKVAAIQRADSLQAIVENKDAEIDALFEVLNDIETNLSEIAAKYTQVRTLQQSSPEGNTRVKGQINDQISIIESMMADNKQKIASLNAKIAELGKENTKLQEFIESLNVRMEEQETQINDLMKELSISKTTIKQLSDNVSDLTQSNKEKDDYIAYQTAEANKAYYIIGSYNELKDLGIVDKNGGFIGIGKKQSTTTNMDVTKFQMIDRTTVKTIAINQRKAKVVSKHPTGSYELVYDENDSKLVVNLNILDVNAFWRYTDYLVVSTK